MKRKDFHQLIIPLTDKLYHFAYCLIPDDLQAEQLVVDALNAYLIKEKKKVLNREVDLKDKKEIQISRRNYFKGILKFIGDIGIRRSIQLNEQMKLMRPEEFADYYSLDPKIRFVLSLRYQANFTVEEIEEIVQIPRYEVIEKIHNGRHLLFNKKNKALIYD